MLADKTNFGLLQGPSILIDKTNFDLVLCKHANFYRFEERSSNWSVRRISVFLCFLLVNQRHTSVITVYNHTVTNIENSVQVTVYNRTVTNIGNTVRAVHSCNSWFECILHKKKIKPSCSIMLLLVSYFEHAIYCGKYCLDVHFPINVYAEIEIYR